MKTKDEIIDQMIDEMPYYFPENIKPYLKEAMEIYAQQKIKKTQINNIMKIRSERYDDIVLEEVFNPVTFISAQKESLSVTMRDSGFEVCYKDKESGERQYYEFKNGVVQNMDDYNKRIFMIPIGEKTEEEAEEYI